MNVVITYQRQQVILKENNGPTVQSRFKYFGVYRTHIHVNVKVEAVTDCM
jgi:hypothetical protein